MRGLQQQSLDGAPAKVDTSFGWPYLRRYALHFAAFAAFSTFAGFEVAHFHGKPAWSADAVQAASISELPAADAAKIEAEAFSSLTPQLQAEQLLDRAIHRDAQSLDLIGQNVDNWRGQLQNTDRLFDLVHTALNSDDLHVRAAAVEIDLASNNIRKSPETVASLAREARTDLSARPLALWRLGALGNRGVQPDFVLAQLLTYVHDRNEETRYWAVEGLAVLGTDAAIDPLLDRFAHDTSPRVRQRAACNLAQSGMLTREQRLAAVPNLLNFFDDDALDSATRGWVYGALRLITGQALGNDADAWRKWWANRDARHKTSSSLKGILHA